MSALTGSFNWKLHIIQISAESANKSSSIQSVAVDSSALRQSECEIDITLNAVTCLSLVKTEFHAVDKKGLSPKIMPNPSPHSAEKNTQVTLLSHTRVKHEAIKHQCIQCGKEFIQRKALQPIKRRHTGSLDLHKKEVHE